MKRVYDARLIKGYRKKLFLLLAVIAAVSSWLYWNRPSRDEMASYVPADSLAFIEANDLGAIAGGIEQTAAWRGLAGPINAPSNLLSHPWLIRLARWTGIGSADAVLVARAQVALVFMQAQATETDNTITIKPLAALVIQTHTTQHRMRAALERHVEKFAQRTYGQPTLTRKQIDAVDLAEWASADNKRRLILAFVDTLAIVGNDESVVLRCVDVRRGKHKSLSGDKQLEKLREQTLAWDRPLFGYVPKAGVKPLIQAWALSRASTSPDAAAVAQLMSNTFGNLADGFAWTAKFDNAGVEDHCFVALAQGVMEKLASSMIPEPLGRKNDFSFVPADSQSVTTYQFRHAEGFWQDLNAVVSSHADVLGAIAARPLLRGLLEPYGVHDAEAFFHAIGPRLQVIRSENNVPAVLVAEAFDRPTLRKLAQQRVGVKSRTETVGDAELLLSTTDNWGVAFVGNYFLSGPSDALRRCISANSQSQSVTAGSSFRRAQALVDVSLPIIALTFTNDRASAISFVELFSSHERSAFSVNAAVIQQASESLPYAVTVTTTKGDGLEWTSKSSFGLLGSLFTTLAPEKSH
jgi:hypothetical protein